MKSRHDIGIESLLDPGGLYPYCILDAITTTCKYCPSMDYGSMNYDNLEKSENTPSVIHEQ